MGSNKRPSLAVSFSQCVRMFPEKKMNPATSLPYFSSFHFSPRTNNRQIQRGIFFFKKQTWVFCNTSPSLRKNIHEKDTGQHFLFFIIRIPSSREYKNVVTEHKKGERGCTTMCRVPLLRSIINGNKGQSAHFVFLSGTSKWKRMLKKQCKQGREGEG